MPLPKFEDWQAPWEKSGEEFDADAAKKLVYNLHRDIEVEKTSLADTKAALATVTEDRDTVRGENEKLKRGDEDETARLKRELEELKNRKPEVDPETARKLLRATIALEKGLTPFLAKRLAGETQEELEADADELLKEFGGSGKEGEGEDADDSGLERRPKPIHNRRAPAGDDDSSLPAYSPEALGKLIPFNG